MLQLSDEIYIYFYKYCYLRLKHQIQKVYICHDKRYGNIKYKLYLREMMVRFI